MGEGERSGHPAAARPARRAPRAAPARTRCSAGSARAAPASVPAGGGAREGSGGVGHRRTDEEANRNQSDCRKPRGRRGRAADHGLRRRGCRRRGVEAHPSLCIRPVCRSRLGEQADGRRGRRGHTPVPWRGADRCSVRGGGVATVMMAWRMGWPLRRGLRTASSTPEVEDEIGSLLTLNMTTPKSDYHRAENILPVF